MLKLLNAVGAMEELAQRLIRMEAQNAEMVRTLQQHQQALLQQTQRSDAAEAGLLEAGRQVEGLRVNAAASVPL